MGYLQDKTNKFREGLVRDYSKKELLEIIAKQDGGEDVVANVRRIEYVFKNKLRHLTWEDGTPIEGRQFSKAELALLVDEPFEADPALTEAGVSIEEQLQAHVAKDPVTWAKTFLGIYPRAYQILILRHPKLRKVLRAGRRLGKTYSMAILLLHYAYTNLEAKAIVIAPMKAQVELIYNEVLKMARESEEVWSSIVRKVTSPQFSIEFSNGSTVRFFTSGMRCMTPDHEVLTADGWEFVSDVNVGDQILTWRDGAYELAPIEAFHEYEYEGDLMVHEGQQVSFSVTPEHRFIAKTRAPNSKWRDVLAEDLKDYYIPTGADSAPTFSASYSKEEMELWGWWLSEGSGFIGKKARFSQKKEYGLHRIQELILATGHDYTVYQYGEKAAEIRTSWKPPVFCGTTSYDKFIPRELFYEDHRESLLRGLLGGDGWQRANGWEYSSSSYQLANDVQELAVLMGLRANLREKSISYQPVNGGTPNRHWIVSGYDRSQSLLNKGGAVTAPYKGNVYCVTVPSGYFLTRHNGLVHVTGNSGGKADVVRGQEAHLIVLDELDYMHPDDLVAILAMLQNTDEGQPDKIMVGASTPTGAHSVFYDWCTNSDGLGLFQEFWFPSYVNPQWTLETEKELRAQYKSEMHYRHEVEADWGEDTEGVYPRKYVDVSFNGDWNYSDRQLPKDFQNYIYVMGVDWDKYGAGTNIAVLRMQRKHGRNPESVGMVELVYREEVIRDEYTLTTAVQRIIELNQTFKPEHIYVDRGYGETQVEMLHLHGTKHPSTGLQKKLKGISFSESIEVRDPYNPGQIDKKEIKPFMVSTLREILENYNFRAPREDSEFRLQLMGYVVERRTQTGRPVFGMNSDKLGDHAHDAVILACHALNQNYGELMRQRFARGIRQMQSDAFAPVWDPNTISEEAKEEMAEKNGGSAPVAIQRNMVMSRARGSRSKITRKMF